jgi:hypothetical protein
VADALGIHTLSCTTGGARTHVHHEIRDLLFAFASGGLLQPALEQCVAHGGPVNLRVDLLLRAGPRPLATDVALCNALAPSSQAAAARDGAATAYELTKIRKYSAACAAVGWSFAPLVVDCFGGWGAQSLPVLQRIGVQWSRARDFPARDGTAYFYTTLSLRLQRLLAHLLMQSVSAAASE